MRREKNAAALPGWDRLRHGGLLFDGTRLAALAECVPEHLGEFKERRLRQRANAILDGAGPPAQFVSFVLEEICGFDTSTGKWTRGTSVSASLGRREITGEVVKPRQLWQGPRGAQLPVFLDDAKRLGVGRSRRVISQVLAWLRAGREHLALVTNGRQWRLLFAGLDYDAWCEWDLDLWFEEGELSAQVTALRTLLQPALWTPEAEEAPIRLLQAIRDTRKGQAELSEVLGERLREAVENLIAAHAEELRQLVQPEEACSVPTPQDIYRAACRVAMRLVVILFAESRSLLPRENALYHESYGLHGLLEQLERDAARGSSMKQSFGAWPRVLALFHLVREGSHHPDLPVTAYGGELFAAGEMEGQGGMSRVIALFERACFESEVLPDSDVYRMLKLLTRTRIRIRQGRGSTWVSAPVDFSDLSSEYIGIVYEGLLDYELKTAPAGDPVVFLAVGNYPALPLSRLEEMDDRAVRTLFDQLKEDSRATDDAYGDDGTSASERANESEEMSVVRDAEPEYVTDQPDERQQNRVRAENWARKAVVAASLVRRPRGKVTPERQLAFQVQLSVKARKLVSRLVLPGEWYLVRWGGTRKGSGSFYTRPGLAVPTVQRALRPLAYDPPAVVTGAPSIDAPVAKWTPRAPEHILSLTVCDPACGSGSFPLAALRFLTDALYASLQHHGRIRQDGQRSLVRLLGAEDDERRQSSGATPLGEELIPCPPDDDTFEPRLKAVLRRHVVERCIYAVDLDPLAVELCRLSLWIETMDRNLPFGFLDHKVKCGNSLVGAWFDQFRHYPVMAWKNREGGDKNHSNGVHFEKNARTKAIKAFVKGQLTPDLKLFLQGRDLFQEDLLEQTATVHDDALAALAAMHEMPVQDAAERARIYREEVLESQAWRSLKEAMDLWCACWFWPTGEIDRAPLPGNFVTPPGETCSVAQRVAGDMRFFHWELEFPDVFREEGSGFDAMLGNPPWDVAKPASKEFFSNIDPLYRSYGKQEALRKQRSYFQDAAVECDWLDHNARFRAQSNFMRYAASPFGDPNDNPNSQGRFAATRGKQNLELHGRWREARARSFGFSDSAHPFRRQGSADLNLYKLFLEAAHTLLGQGGRMGFICPSGLYSDHGTRPLRALFLNQCRWEWLFGLENREGIFPIHRSYKFNPIIVQKGGATEAVQAAFMRRNMEDWERAEDHATFFSNALIERFSPKSRAILEIQSARDLEILEKIYANSALLGDDDPEGWGIRYAREFDMTNDSRLFPPRPQWEAKGYRPDEYSRWLLGDWRPIEELWDMLGVDPARPEPPKIEIEEWLFDTAANPEQRDAQAQFIHGHLLKPGDLGRSTVRRRCVQPRYDQLPVPRADLSPGIVLAREGDAWIWEDRVLDAALPFFEGRMIGQFDFSQKGWVRGKGRSAVWRDIPLERKQIEPQYLMSEEHHEFSERGPKLAMMDVTSSTNTRTMIVSPLGRTPCGHSIGVLNCAPKYCLPLSAVLNSFAYDFALRVRFSGLHTSWFIIEETPLPRIGRGDVHRHIARLSASAGLADASLAWINFLAPDQTVVTQALTDHERLRISVVLNVLIASEFDLEVIDLQHVLQECDLPRSRIGDGGLNPKGFWRVDKDNDPELRHTVLTLIAFHDLESKIKSAGGDRKKGLEAFLSQNHGEGWMLPEMLRLADYDLGHDERAKHPQPVASRLGPRFYDWQLAQSPEESWRECHLHARNLLGEHGYSQLLADLGGEGAPEEQLRHRYIPREPAPTTQPLSKVAEPNTDCRSDKPSRSGQSELFE